MAIKRKKTKFDLGTLDSEWKDCFLLLRTMTIKEVKELQKATKKVDEDSEESIDMMVDMIKERIVGGQVLDEDGSRREYVETDLDDLLDIPTVKGIVNALQGGLA